MDYKKLLRIFLVMLPVLTVLPLAYIGISDADVFKKLAMILVVLLVSLIGAGNIWFNKKILKFNQMIFLSLITAGVALTAFLSGNVFHGYMPLMIGVMLTGIIIDRQVAMQLHLCLILSVAVVTGQDMVFILYYIIAGFVTATVVQYAKERHRMLVVLGGLSAFCGFLYGLLLFVVEGEVVLLTVFIIMLNVALSLIVVIGSLPLWESIFKVMTPHKMLEYASNDHKLMQRLLMEAPGTFHHVQMVGNLAERGAKAIGADGLLAKTGAIFHDVGKLKEPGYFIENQNGGPNPHDDIVADASARIIIDHVAYGVKLAGEYHLPGAVRDIIREHHGTSLVKYFYNKAQFNNDGIEYEETAFRYQGPIPQSKEAAIVMLADCTEAYVRSLSEEERHLDKIHWIIDEITRQKFVEGQLDDAGLTVGELKVVGNGFMQVYNGLYHERISYPNVEVEAEV